MSEQPSNVHTNHGGSVTEDLAALLAEHAGAHHITVGGGSYIECDALACEARWATVAYNGTEHAKHVAEVIAAAGWANRRAVIEELITKAETGPTDGTHDPHAAYWLRAELDGEG